MYTHSRTLSQYHTRYHSNTVYIHALPQYYCVHPHPLTVILFAMFSSNFITIETHRYLWYKHRNANIVLVCWPMTLQYPFLYRTFSPWVYRSKCNHCQSDFGLNVAKLHSGARSVHVSVCVSLGTGL